MKELKAVGASYGRSAIAGMLAVYMTGESDPKKLAWVYSPESYPS